ncbi:hypothetical protein MHC_03420 [Mycoplasma haemocanis str. Illinois]|uniref:Uncharacterized protein n=1 Tax=Mycoplasma haemocanis (strain Illinois) TaxID=1111676 RepID=H6N7C2_MYCHN|nr:hypothetical protein [Mycoplasma haemocanis]AEW45544.1 hypothetical protein MHC_03420 [Mycoplasma haemocanis str. Illinois]
MSKLTLPLIGLGGASTAAVGGYMFFIRGEKSTVEKTFRSTYSQAILKENDNLWSTKLAALRSEGNPIHKTLIDAKAKVTTSEQQAKSLLVEGCRKIYDSKLSDSLYEKDFKTYCSKTIKDVIQGTWISEAHDGSGSHTKWNQKLTSLKEHAEATKGVLSKGLQTLKGQLSSEASSTNWDDAKRKVLKDWCDASKKEIFMGETDSRVLNSKSYCLES